MSESVDYEEVGGDPELRARYQEALAEYNKAKAQSLDLQRKLIFAFSNLGIDESPSAALTEAPSKYQEQLTKFKEYKDELENTQKAYSTQIAELRARHKAAQQLKEEKAEAFRAERKTIAQTALMSRTNKPVPTTDLNARERDLEAKERDLEETQTKFIETKNKHIALEEELSQQDQLSEGLHLIDFEQLKIENQTLTDKKADKKQKLKNFEDKIRLSAHMLTHVKEKLAFVQKQNEELRKQNKEIDDAYAESRTKLASMRAGRDKVRDENATLKKASGLIGMTDLLYDFERRSNELELMQDKVTELKTRFNDLTSMQHELEAKIAQRQPIDPELLRLNR